MEKVKEKAYGKINLGLDVIRKREDGYHELKMIMQTVGLCDELELSKRVDDKINLIVDTDKLSADESNLVYKAIKLIKDTYGIEQGVDASLTKRIPIAAGMAGGSADCAAALRGMNKLFDLGITTEELCVLGKKLGADVPFCVVGGTHLAEGIGEKLTPITPIRGDYLVLAKPSIDVPTKYVYENLRVNDGIRVHPDIDILLEAVEARDFDKLYKNMGNILESVTVEKYGVIDDIKKDLVSLGAKAALMSGSGPTVFAVYGTEEQAHNAVKSIDGKYDLDTLCVTTFV